MCYGDYKVKSLHVYDGENVSLVLDGLEILLYNTDLKFSDREEKVAIAGRANVAIKDEYVGYRGEIDRVAVKAGYSKTENAGWVNIWLAKSEVLSNEELLGQALTGI